MSLKIKKKKKKERKVVDLYIGLMIEMEKLSIKKNNSDYYSNGSWLNKKQSKRKKKKKKSSTQCRAECIFCLENKLRSHGVVCEPTEKAYSDHFICNLCFLKVCEKQSRFPFKCVHPHCSLQYKNAAILHLNISEGISSQWARNSLRDNVPLVEDTPSTSGGLKNSGNTEEKTQKENSFEKESKKTTIASELKQQEGNELPLHEQLDFKLSEILQEGNDLPLQGDKFSQILFGLMITCSIFFIILAWFKLSLPEKKKKR